MPDEIVNCPYCKGTVSARKLAAHTSKRCPKSPMAIQNKKASYEKAYKPASRTPKVVLVRSRLERLFRDLNSGSGLPDDEELAKVFKAFYTMYIWQGDGKTVTAAKSSMTNSDGETSTSIHTVSGGLPSLGKRAK